MGDYSSFLFANPSFAEGAARMLDFGDTLTDYNNSATNEEADRNALWSDWMAVAGDLREAMDSALESEPELRVKKK